MRYLISFFILSLFVSVSSLQAQENAPTQPDLLTSKDVSDQQVNHFVDALQYVQKVQEESQPKMIKAIQDEGLNPQQFMQAAQAAQQGVDTGLNTEDQKKFDAVQKKVEGIQIEANGQIESKIKEKDMSLEKFNQIYLSYQQSPELKLRIENQLKKVSE